MRFAKTDALPLLPHHGSRGWMAVKLEDDLDWEEIAELLESAYRQVAPRSLISE